MQATILDVPMPGWPPTTYLVQLDTALQRFNPEDGTLLDEHFYVAVCCKDSDPREAFVFPATETGGFVDSSMIPMRRRDYGLPAAVLAQLGYET